MLLIIPTLVALQQYSLQGYQQQHRFIATQGPLNKTVNDFWMMVAEQESVVIVMLAKCVEAGKVQQSRFSPSVPFHSTLWNCYLKGQDNTVYQDQCR